MDSTPISPNNPPKLPIKRKIPSPPHDHIDGGAPPFKFHRIWTEPDEIRFLQELLNCSSQNLAFPRDLGIFYARFSNAMSQPYTKSQLSEKLRRLRKKFRVISTRLAKGMNRSQLSLHDRALFDLSKRLWHPDYSVTSPFSGVRNVGLDHGNDYNCIVSNGGYGVNGDGQLNKSSLVGIKVNFSATLPVGMSGQGIDRNHLNSGLNFVGNWNQCVNKCSAVPVGNICNVESENEVAKLSEVNVEFERGEGEEPMEDEGNGAFGGEICVAKVGAGENIDFGCENKIGEVVVKVVLNVLDECFKDVRRLVASRGSERAAESFQVRWQQQKMAELDVLGSRLRLVLENSLRKL